MIIPSLIDAPIGIDKNGNPVELHPVYKGLFQQLLQQLQQGLGNEGIIMPPQSAGNVALLTQSQPGTTLYNSTTNKLMVNENGVFKTVTTS